MDDIDLSFDFEAEIDAKDALRKASLKADGLSTSAENAASKGRHSIVCKHWLRKLCMKGDKCDFLHQYDPNKMPECSFWLKTGKCPDPDCTFRHVATSERPECQRYRRGFCRYGPMCRSRHDRLPRESLPEILPDWFLDALFINSDLIPRAEDVRLIPSHLDRDRLGNGSSLALMPLSAETEQGTIPGLPPPIHGKCRYYVMRSMNVRNIQISAHKGIWATSLGNSQRLRQSFRDVDHVILIFAATESRNFLGYAKMLQEPDDHLFPGVWGDLSNRLSPNMRVQWLKQCTVPVYSADHIKNPPKSDTPVRRCRDGQDLPPTVGEVLCRFLWQQPHTDLLRGSDLEFEPRVNYDTALAIRDQDREAPSVAGGEAGAKAKTGSSVALALEDAKKEGTDQLADDGRERPAPVPMGTFMSDGSWKSQGAVTVGKALASGSSSLLAAMTEDAQRHGQAPPPGWPGAVPPGWRPPPMELRPPGYGFPPPGYYPVGFGGAPMPFGFPPPGPAGAPPPRGPPGQYGEVPPPGFWGERAQFSQPPAGWEGASSALACREERDRRGRSRSRSRARQRKRRN